jgi:hypothetical protein
VGGNHFQSLSRERLSCHRGATKKAPPGYYFQSLKREQLSGHANAAGGATLTITYFQSLSRDRPSYYADKNHRLALLLYLSSATQTFVTRLRKASEEIGVEDFQSLKRDPSFHHSPGGTGHLGGSFFVINSITF